MTDRLHYGCGPVQPGGWVNADATHVGQAERIFLGSGRLPYSDAAFDYAVGNHVLQEVPYHDLVPALAELRRVIKPGGILRMIEPDVSKAVLCTQGKFVADWLGEVVADDVEPEASGKLCAWLSWYSLRRSVFTSRWLQDLATRAGFEVATVRPFGGTAPGFDPEITSLDSRRDESCIVEAS